MMQIRAMKPGDIPEIHSIEKASFPQPWSIISFYIFYMHPNLFCWVLLQNGKLCAYICFERMNDFLHLQNLAVCESQRKNGIAQKLLNRLQRYAQKQLLKEIRLEVSAANNAALALYRKNRFTENGIIRAYYEHDRSDALLMRKTLETQ